MRRPSRNPIPKDAVSEKKQAMETIQRIPSSKIASIAASPAAQQLLKISHKQEMFPATVASSDAVRGEVRRVETPDFLKVRYRR